VKGEQGSKRKAAITKMEARMLLVVSRQQAEREGMVAFMVTGDPALFTEDFAG
jgi:hypothetical protein